MKRKRMSFSELKTLPDNANLGFSIKVIDGQKRKKENLLVSVCH